MADDDGKIGTASLLALAVGGMVGGGIYVALGVVVEAAGRWAWLSFAVAGVVAVTTAHGYGRLSNHFEVGGGSFAFLEKMDRTGMAGSLSWVLLVSYTLTSRCTASRSASTSRTRSGSARRGPRCSRWS